ncbi:MAG: LysM domain-containing protein [Polyangiaceae bacterium]
MKSFFLALATALGLLLPPKPAMALVHVVQSGDTLAALAERYYGRIQFERILVAANRLDVGGGTALIPGMHLVVPTVTYVTVPAKETWAGLAQRYLGSAQRSDVLSMANGFEPVAGTGRGNPGPRAIQSHRSGQLRRDRRFRCPKVPGRRQTRVDVDALQQSEERAAGARNGDPRPADGSRAFEQKSRCRSRSRAACTRSGTERAQTPTQDRLRIPTLIADVRSGRYIDAIARGNRFLASNVLTLTQHALVLRLLVESYVAFDAAGAATAACAEWRKLDPALRLNPTDVSPKILKVCGAPPQ